MKIYSEPLPTGFMHNGKTYPIDTDFRTWIKFEELVADNDIASDLRLGAVRRLVFLDEIPIIDETVMNWLIWFLRCGEDVRSDGKRHIRAYSMSFDEGFIFSAFWQTYGIDLAKTTDMHWWKFTALFRGLRDTKFNDICGYRTAEIDRNTPKPRAEFLKEMQDFYELPETITDRERRELARKFYG